MYKAPSTLIQIFLKPHTLACYRNQPPVHTKPNTFFTRISLPSTGDHILFYTNQLSVHTKPHTFLHDISLPSTRNSIPLYTNQPSVHTKSHTFLHESAFRPHEEANLLHETAFRPYETAYFFTRIDQLFSVWEVFEIPSMKAKIVFK